MRMKRKLLLGILIAGLCSTAGHARSTDVSDENVSEIIKLSLTRSETQSDACKTAKRSVSNKCGQSYIYPIVSNHPDSAVADTINVFIEELAQNESDNFSRVEEWTEVTLNKQNILSLSYTGQLYGRGAYSDKTVKTCTNFDLTTGKKIALNDILLDGYQEALPRIIFENLETDLKYKLPGYVRSLFKQKGAEWTFDPDQSFALNDRDLTLCFEHDPLSTETVGPVSLPLPYALVTELIDENGPLTFTLDQANAETESETEPAKATIPDRQTIAEKVPEPIKAPTPTTLPETANRIGSLVHTCFKDSVTHTISVVEHAEGSPFICIVEYDKEYEQKVLWRSRKTKEFCHNSAEKLVAKYENQWDYTCGQTSSLPGN